jgi:hypothetical protein
MLRFADCRSSMVQPPSSEERNRGAKGLTEKGLTVEARCPRLFAE